MTPTLPQTKTQTQKKTYQPSRTEALASQIFGFVTSATELSSALSSSSSSSSGREKEKENGVSGGLATDEGINGMNGNGNGKQEEKDADAEDREEEGADDVKLLRFRSKRNEVVVVPDKKYILCVVHDAASSSGGGASRGFR